MFIGELVFRSANSTTTIPVSVAVGPTVFVQPPALKFTKTFGAANPLSQDVNIASTGTNFDFDHSWSTANGGNWLSVTVAGFNCCATPRAITANITAGPTLPVGTYTGQIVNTVEGNGSMAMTIPVTLTVLASPTTAEFNDVPVDASYFQAANLMYNYGVTTGCILSDTPANRSYCPNNNVTRQEMAAFIVRAATGTTVPATSIRRPTSRMCRLPIPSFPIFRR